MNLVPSRCACHSPRPASAAHAPSRPCRRSGREICSAHSFPSLPNTRSARAHTPSPIDSSCIRSLIAPRCNSLLFRRPAANRVTPRETRCNQLVYQSVKNTARPRQRTASTFLVHRDLKLYPRRHYSICCSCRVRPPLHGARACSFTLNRHLTPTEYNAHGRHRTLSGDLDMYVWSQFFPMHQIITYARCMQGTSLTQSARTTDFPLPAHLPIAGLD
jgi:hypothetical protein